MAMLHKLFSSKVRIELLNTFFLHPEKSFYLRELERITGGEETEETGTGYFMGR